MPKNVPNNVQIVRDQIAIHMGEIAKLFLPGIMITVICRMPDDPEREMMLSNEDDYSEIQKAVERSKDRPAH